MVCGRSRSENLFLPVGTLTHRGNLGITEGWLSKCVGVDKIDVVEPCPLLGVHKVEPLDLVLHTALDIVLHLSLACLSFLGGDKDDTVRSAATVNGSCRCILEDLEGLDVIRIDGGCTGRNSVDYVQRIIATLDGVDTTDSNRVITLRATCVLGDHNSRHTALKGIHRIGNGIGCQFLGLYMGNGSRKVAATHGTVTDNHCILKPFHVVRKNHVQGGGCSHGCLYSRIAD